MGSRISPAPGAAQADRILARRRALLELVVGYGLILLVIWSERPLQRVLYYAATLFLVAVLWMSFHSASAMGLRRTNFWRSSWVIGVALLIAAMAVAIALHFHVMHPLEGPVPFLRRYWGYMLWSFVQQILLVDFFLRRFLRLLSRPSSAVLATAAVFAAAHLPNPVLTVVTLVFGTAACLIFLRYRNLYPLAIAHAILGITIAITVPGPIIRNMRVGLGYFTYTRHHHRHRVDSGAVGIATNESG
jgi:membrane protease YdiL (CAAX protease family)